MVTPEKLAEFKEAYDDAFDEYALGIDQSNVEAFTYALNLANEIIFGD